MVNYQNPVTVVQEFVAVMKVWHVVNGIFIWEFVTTLNYEWDVFRGNRPYRWTIWVYSTARAAALMALVLNMVDTDTSTPINCQVWIAFEATFIYVAIVASSLLIVLRIISIWNRERIVSVLVLGLWVADILLIISGIVRIRSSWSPVAHSCQLLNFESTKLSTVAVLFTDIVLLLIMLIGLLRLRSEGGATFGLGLLLWKQGLIWLLVATVAEIPSAVLMILNLNVPLDLMPQAPTMVAVTIAATRTYRSLVDFGSNEISHEYPGSGCGVSDMRIRAGNIQLNRMEVSMRTDSTERDQFPTPQSSYVSAHQVRYKAHEVRLKVDLESGQEK